MSTEIELLIQLKTQLVNFFDELIETFPDESDFVIFRILIKDKVPILDIMNYIVKDLCPLYDMVKNKNESFFLDNNILFSKFDEKKTEKINRLKKLWLSGTLDKENKEVMWSWFNSIIYLGTKFHELKLREKLNM
jgi:hypothetical protein